VGQIESGKIGMGTKEKMSKIKSEMSNLVPLNLMKLISA
jgi:hypothetical protein